MIQKKKMKKKHSLQIHSERIGPGFARSWSNCQLVGAIATVRYTSTSEKKSEASTSDLACLCLG